MDIVRTKVFNLELKKEEKILQIVINVDENKNGYITYLLPFAPFSSIEYIDYVINQNKELFIAGQKILRNYEKKNDITLVLR